MSYIKEELIGRKFETAGDIYTIEKVCNNKVYLSWSDEEAVGGVEYDSGNYTVKEVNKYLEDNIWKLLPEEIKVYTTPKGIKYGVGTKFTTHVYEYEFTENEANYLAFKALTGDIGKIFTFYTKSMIEYNFDNEVWTIIQDYQQVDPSTIKFDFTNTKIKVNNAEESEWIQRVAFNSGYSLYRNEREVKNTETKALYFDTDNDISYDLEGSLEYSPESREITIQDILNSNQMKEVIEVGDTYQNKKYPEYTYTIAKIEGNIVTWTVGSVDYLDKLLNVYKLVSKANKQDIIGYELLKDLPGISAGTKSGTRRVNGIFTFYVNDENNINYKESQLQDTTWFKPIYKAKEVELKFSKYTATLSKEHGLVFTDNERINFTNLVTLLEELNKSKKDIGKYSDFTVSYEYDITNVTVGCKSFSKADVQLITVAIQDFK